MSDLKNLRVALTGATGFLGHAVMEELGRRGARVRALVRSRSDGETLQREHAHVDEVHRGDLTDARSLKGFVQEGDLVIHCAGLREFWHPRTKTFYDVNEKGTENLMKAALAGKAAKVVNVSTVMSYGFPKTMPFNERSEVGPHASDYARSKYLGDRAAWLLHEKKGLPLVTVYLAAIIGPGDPLPSMEIGRFLHGELVAMVGGDITYTFIDLQDAVTAIVAAAVTAKNVGERYLVGGERASTWEYFGHLSAITGIPLPKQEVPLAVARPIAKTLTGISRLTKKRPLLPADVLNTLEAGSLLFDDAKARRELGLRYRPLRKSLQDVVASMK